MANYTYKCVPIPAIVITAAKGKDLHVEATATHERLINDVASEGWEFVSIETISSSAKAGCLSILTGGRNEELVSKMIVFRREV
jgi:hypothetical protein